MSYGRFHDAILGLLQRNGAMGVNQLAKELDVPLSTLQKYLDKDQTYFKKNHSRKWVLPEEAANTDMSVVSSNYVSVIDSQLMSMNALIETLMSQFRATLTLIETNKPQSIPVAGMSPKINPRLIDFDKKLKEAEAVFKKYVGKCPEEYRDLINNTDMCALTLDKGREYANGLFNEEISALFLEKNDTLSEEVLKVLESYQKET